MSKTLLVILAHSGASEALSRHWKFWELAGCEILGVDRTDTRTQWPHKVGTHNFFDQISVGMESYASGENHLRRFIDVIEYCQIAHREHESYCVIEYDALTFGKLPKGPINYFRSHLAGNRSPGFHGLGFYHCPWWVSARTAELMIDYGRRMLRAELYEQGFLDRWLGLMLDLYDIPVEAAAAYSHNTLDTPEKIEGAREAIRRGAIFVHGVKTASQLEALTKDL